MIKFHDQSSIVANYVFFLIQKTKVNDNFNITSNHIYYHFKETFGLPKTHFRLFSLIYDYDNCT